MEVVFKLHGSLRRFAPAGSGGSHEPLSFVLDEGVTVGGALQALGVPAEFISGVAVNGEVAELETVLKDGDTVHVFPPAAGGA